MPQKISKLHKGRGAHGRGIPIFGVMTKKDKFKHDAQIHRRTDDFLSILGIDQNSFAWIQNYCPDVDNQMTYHTKVFPYIDVPVLSFLTQVAGSEAQRVYNTFDIVADDKEKIDVLKDRFKVYCEPRKNLTYIRHVFFTRNQGPHENIDSYVTDLKNKAKPCEFEHLSDGLIRDRIVCGIQNEGCRARLLREADLTLVKAIDTCRAQEIDSQQLKSLKSTEEHSVNAVKQVNKSRYRQNDSHKNQRSVHVERQALCKNCGRTHGKRNCPAFGKECHSCNKKNHFAKYCMSKQKKKVDAIQYDYYDSEDELFIGTVSVDSIQQCEEWKESMSINKQSVVFKLDTGAQANIISEKLFRKLSLPDNRTEKTNIKLVTYDGHKISPIGTRMLKCTFKDRKYNLKFFIVPTDSQPILSADTCSEIGAIVRVRAVDKPLTKEEVISDYGETFKGLGTLPKTHHIERYDLRIVYVPGKLMFISDALSRAYLPDSNDKLIDDELDISYIEKQLPISSRKIAEIKDATEADENLRKLSSVVVSGWPNSKEMLPDDIQSYWNFRDEITVIDGIQKPTYFHT
ncbi:unnamed protein product [Mytilus edulis]|uniref:Peptidase A2 domain-containing protein n=1 Tax=Mytilus edulis TaxID=6550 RepID=A0A8S3R2S5_MYTED|nr:unnamed protein product [Mytilus edulis]